MRVHDALPLPSNASEAANPSWVRIARPLLPKVDKIAPYLRQIDAERFYTNGGVLQQHLLNRISQHYSLDVRQIGLAGSGTAAIAGLLLGTGERVDAKRPLCVCPAYTFVATACAAEICGYAPYLADVNPETWALDPDAVAALPAFSRVGAVIVVEPYGRSIDLDVWRNFSQQTGRIVVVDAAASFDTLSPSAIIAAGLPVAVSLHATKTLSTAEGGMMLCGDMDVVKRAVAAVNFGFDGSRRSILPGLNGKISEYHAAIGLAEFDTWQQKRSAFIAKAGTYVELAESAGLGDRVIVNSRQALPYALFMARNQEEAVRIHTGLADYRVETRYWYGGGLQAQPAYANCERDLLPATQDLAARLIGLPLAVDLPRHDISRTIDALRSILDNQDSLCMRPDKKNL